MKKNKLQLLPFPDGKDFAVTFVDDTDFSTVKNIKPVYDFLHSRNVKGTKTVWTTIQKRSSAFKKKDEKQRNFKANSGLCLQNPDYLAFIIDLKNKGFEIALHNVSAGNSYREEIIEGLKCFKHYLGHDPKINVFHERNIENLYCGIHKLDLWPLKVFEKITDNSDYQGHIEESPYFWGDIAAETIKYTRLPFHEIPEVNTLKLNPSMPFYDPKRPYVNYWFSNSDGSNCDKFVKLLSDANVSRLKSEKGACLIYTHFANDFTEKKGGQYRLNERFVDVIMNFISYSSVWLPTASELLDRLLECQAITIKQKDFEVEIINENTRDIEGLTLKIDSNIILTDFKGNELRPSRDGNIIIDKLPAKSSLTFKSSQKVNYVYNPKNKQNINRWERIKIELYNYYGLLKEHIKQFISVE